MELLLILFHCSLWSLRSLSGPLIGLVSRGLHPDMAFLDLLLVFFLWLPFQVHTLNTQQCADESVPLYYNMLTHGVYWLYEVIVNIRESLKRLDWGGITVHLCIPVQHSDMPPFPSKHKEHIQIEYSFMNAVGLHSRSFSMYCATKIVYRNGASAYICTCGLVEYRASKNVTQVCSKRQEVYICEKTINYFFVKMRFFLLNLIRWNQWYMN